MYRYQDARFSRGKARLRAPIIKGTKKFPKTAGMLGIRKKNTMMMPCALNALLYDSDSIRSPRGVRSSMRISAAATAPIKKNSVTEIRYMMAMRLWSSVNSHDCHEWSAFR